MIFHECSHGYINPIIEELPLPDHVAAFRAVVRYLTESEEAVVASLSEISAIGHRIVNAGPFFNKSTLITDEVLNTFKEKSIPYAPLHNPAALQGINACFETMNGIPQVLVFDTTFHQTMPEEAYMYGVPYDWYEKHGVRRYGAHGMSHQFVTEEAARLLGKSVDQINMISCHLGNGSSISAIRNGKCVDTSMGFTPLEGLVMGTRSGDIDPTVIPYLMKKRNLTPDEMSDLLNKKSGLLGVTGISNDSRNVEEAASKGDHRAKLALNILKDGIKRYIGGYTALMNGLDVLVFTAGIGENSWTTRERVCEDMNYLGIKIDKERNKNFTKGIPFDISDKNSKVKVLVIPTNEEYMIALDTLSIINK